MTEIRNPNPLDHPKIESFKHVLVIGYWNL